MVTRMTIKIRASSIKQKFIGRNKLRRFAGALILLSTIFGLTLQCFATTVIVPSDDDLIIGSRAIVQAKIISVVASFDEQRSCVFTYTTMRVREVLKGRITTSEIVIKELGGQAGDTGTVVYGTPQFAVGERVILFLDTWNDGSLRVHDMFLGKYSIIREAGTNREIAIREAPGAHVEVLGQAPEGAATRTMELGAFLRMVRRKAAALETRSRSFEETYYSYTPLLDRPVEFNGAVARGGVFPQFHLFSPPMRWFQPDSGQPVSFLINSAGAPAGVDADVAAAMNAWSTVSGCSLRVTNGGPTSDCVGSQNTIVFDNCDNWFAPESGCSGILAKAGIIQANSTTKVVNGTTFFQAVLGHMSFNPFAACYFGNHAQVQEIATHEMGHALGLHHSWDPTFGGSATPSDAAATMYYIAHFDGRAASLRQDDINGITFIYPAGSGGGGAPTITTTTLPGGTVGQSYSASLNATGGTSPYSWSILSGLLPPGLSLSGSAISGTPLTSGSFSFTANNTTWGGNRIVLPGATSIGPGQPLAMTFTAFAPSTPGTYNLQLQMVKDGGGGAGQFFGDLSTNVAIAVGTSNPLSISTTSLAGGTVNVAYGAQVTATGGSTPYAWSIIGGALPANVIINSSSGVITGTPTAAGISTFTVQVRDNQGATVQRQLSITINSSTSPLQITTTTLGAATRNSAYSQQLAATGGIGSYTWVVTSSPGPLPAGLTLSSSGMIGGAPSVSGSFSFTVQVTDSAQATAQRLLSLTVNPEPLSIATSAISNATSGSQFTFQLAASGGSPNYTWLLLVGNLPSGMSLSSTGVISGISTGVGGYNFTVQVRDTAQQTVQKALSMVVSPALLQVTTPSLPSAAKGASYNQQILASGGTLPYRWSISSGNLPNGMILNTATGVVSGVCSVAGNFNFLVTVSDASNVTAAKQFQVQVIDPATIPRIDSVKYKAGAFKLIIRGANFDSQAVLLVDGVPVKIKNNDGENIVGKPVELGSGSHQFRVVNSNGLSSDMFVFTVN
ncbi:MAG: hypothetical protein DMF61_09775 [Blastocatellia bacterium AA13]|nr:MAG: hypothetical protein DMF61_09775 [Blastocatellia bacterium AA13]